MVKSRLKKSSPECPFECGGGAVIGGTLLKGGSLSKIYLQYYTFMSRPQLMD